MKRVPKILLIAFLTIGMITFAGCKKDAENPLITTPKITTPVITTASLSTITTTSAETGGNVTSGGGSEVLGKGVCWSISANPTIADSKTNDGTGTGIFTSFLTGLIPGTTYFVRAYATNSAGTA